MKCCQVNTPLDSIVLCVNSLHFVVVVVVSPKLNLVDQKKKKMITQFDDLFNQRI